MSDVTLTDGSGTVRMRGTLTGVDAFNGGTITAALTIDKPTGSNSLIVNGGGDPVINGSAIAQFNSGGASPVNVLTLFSDGTFQLLLDETSPGTFRLRAGGTGHVLEATGDDKLGFFNTSAVAKPTGVPVTAAGIHAALVTLGLIAA